MEDVLRGCLLRARYMSADGTGWSVEKGLWYTQDVLAERVGVERAG